MKDGQYVRDSRDALGLTQAQFADALGVTIRTVSNWETNAVPLPDSRRRHIELLLRQMRKR